MVNCSQCQTENPDGAKFCNQCGAKLDLVCPECGHLNPPTSKFCNECGRKLGDASEPEKSAAKPGGEPSPAPVADGERKYVTVLFSDMAGYTAMSERLDPEEVKEITGRIFAQVSQIVAKYDGFIEKYVGDAVMALFGVPVAHEDDPIRAVMAAREIHAAVEKNSPQWESRIGRPLAMHSGINTGLVVTGEINLEQGTHGVAGDTINLAARLSSLAEDGQVIVGPETYLQAQGYFSFEKLGPTKVKGKAESIQTYKVLAFKMRPGLFRRTHGLRAELIGRRVELDRFIEAAQALDKGRGGFWTVSGEAGTGKTRLIEEFRATLDPDRPRWFEGQAYAFSQTTPYAPLIDLLNRLFGIEEMEGAEGIRHKVAVGVNGLSSNGERFIPYVGSLYSLSYPEVELGSPEFWKSRLQEAMVEIFSGLAKQGPTIICLEDMHWADPSTIDCLKNIVSKFKQPAMLICAHRPRFSPFTAHEIAGMGTGYQEISLSDLSTSETQKMLESLLGATDLPRDLRRFVQDKVGGNPFYIEEVVNSLIESGALKKEKRTWLLARRIRDLDMPSTVQGIISARLDRLEKESKRILQEASVIGRAFLHDILKRTTDLTDDLERALGGLERLDLIQTRAVHPELEYVFKQAVIQDVVYHSLLKKERRTIHRRIAAVIEELFNDRLDEFCETLAFHWIRAEEVERAVQYSILAGQKSLARYSVDEAHQYFQEAFDLLTNTPDRTADQDLLLIDLIVKWALVYYYRGDFKGIEPLLLEHLDLARTLGDEPLLGMYTAWIGFTFWSRERLTEGRDYLLEALALGERAEDPWVIGYACAWLAWNCGDLGLIDEGIAYGERARQIAATMPEDQYLHFKSLGAIAFCGWWGGEVARTIKCSEDLLDYGRRHANVRCLVLGYYAKGQSLHLAGDFEAAARAFREAMDVSADPLYIQFPKLMHCISLVQAGQFDQVEAPLNELLDFGQKFGCENLLSPTQFCLSALEARRGRLGKALKMMEDVREHWKANNRQFAEAWTEHTLGQFYLEMITQRGNIGLGTMAKNVGFIMKHAPKADKTAQEYLDRSLAIFNQRENNPWAGAVYLDLGRLHLAKDRHDRAKQCLSEAIRISKQSGAHQFLAQAEEALAELG